MDMEDIYEEELLDLHWLDYAESLIPKKQKLKKLKNMEDSQESKLH